MLSEPLRPGRIGGAATAAELLAQYPLPGVGDHLVGEPHEVEPVGDQHGVGEAGIVDYLLQ
jgi:hypothetical protein